MLSFIDRDKNCIKGGVKSQNKRGTRTGTPSTIGVRMSDKETERDFPLRLALLLI